MIPHFRIEAINLHYKVTLQGDFRLRQLLSGDSMYFSMFSPWPEYELVWLAQPALPPPAGRLLGEAQRKQFPHLPLAPSSADYRE